MSTTGSIRNISEALEALGVNDSVLTEEEKRQLDENGYILFPGLIDPEWLKALRARVNALIEKEGDAAGKEVNLEKGTRRLADLVNKGEVFDNTYLHPKLLAAAYHILQREFRFNSLNARDSMPGEGLQGLHADWKERTADEPYYIVNSIWLLDDFTEENGATRFVPGTHKMKGLPKDHVEDPRAPHPDQVLLIAPKGTVAVFNSHLWHGGTLNRSNGTRMCIHSSYVSRDSEQQTNQREYFRKKTNDRISDAAKYILDI
jgi:ectoine hydroxylase-related dioxygenase (phytanoyl-CoA dioxygenase family)